MALLSTSRASRAAGGSFAADHQWLQSVGIDARAEIDHIAAGMILGRLCARRRIRAAMRPPFRSSWWPNGCISIGPLGRRSRCQTTSYTRSGSRCTTIRILLGSSISCARSWTVSARRRRAARAPCWPVRCRSPHRRRWCREHERGLARHAGRKGSGSRDRGPARSLKLGIDVRVLFKHVTTVPRDIRVRLGQEHHAAVRSDPSAIKGGAGPLASYCW
jgi:hypothetical protein